MLRPSEKTEPERFYHGFVLGLMVELKDRYTITSNRESGFGRYDVMLEPEDPARDDAIIIEFKVYDPEDGEETLADTAEASGMRFIMIIDEWDAPIRENPEISREYLQFLRTLFKSSSMTDKIFAAVYMTGILPIKKDGSQSALSDFREYTMLAPGRFAPYIGFEESEVKTLCDRYNMDFSEMQFWYDGYSFINTGSIYNPNSVMECVSRGRFDSYWRQSSVTDNLLHFINLDFDGLQKAVAQLLGGSDVEIDPSFFQNDIHILTSRDDALTLLVHLGYLSFDEDEKTVRIPNEEIRLEFAKMIRKVRYTETILRVKDSDQLIEDTILMKEDEVAAQIQKIHMEETAPLFYNNEQALRAVIKLAYFSYKDHYIKLEELPSGKGFADIVYLPRKSSMYPAILIELKAEGTPEGAIGQIKEKNYPEELRNYGGEVLLVGISYAQKTKEHRCTIEKFRL